MDVLFGVTQRIGQVRARLIAARASLAWGALGALAALVPALWMWGFTVDDALISIRYARHLAAGLGWRFDAGGPSTDGVTPLPWPVVLRPLARADALEVLDRARALGVVLWTATGCRLGVAIAGVPARTWVRGAALGTLALSVPVAAHAVSGMETALAMSLATAAVVTRRGTGASAWLAGLAAALRPEMAPWACVLAAGLALAAAQGPRRALGAAGRAIAPFAGCALVRLVAWGRPAPLALLAKPSDLQHGLAYAGAGCVVTLLPLLVLAPVALRRDARAAAVVGAAAVHLGAVALVGGDWMPYARLVAPVVPSLAYAAVRLGACARPAATGLRALAALAAGVFLIARGGTEGRRVEPDRRALIERARLELAGVTRVAALDVGWVGAATEADVIDLAGVTDPTVAVLPGGHTSKRVDAGFLLDRRPDALLLYLPGGLAGGDLGAWQDADYPRRVEARLAQDAAIGRRFTPAAWLPLGVRGAGYVLLRGQGTGER